jgi:hypothetical protein
MSQDAAGDLFGGFTVRVYGQSGGFAVERFANCQNFGNFLINGTAGEAGA